MAKRGRPAKKLNEGDNLERLSLAQLVRDQSLCAKVVTMMSSNKSYAYIIKYLNRKGYAISKGSLTNFKRKLEESNRTGKPLVAVVDKRGAEGIYANKMLKDIKVTSIDDILAEGMVEGFTGDETKESMVEIADKANKEDNQPKDNQTNQSEETKPTKQNNVKQEVVEDVKTGIPVYSTQQILESMLQKAMRTIEETDYLDTAETIKVIDLYEKYYGQRTRGLTSEALKQYQLYMNVRDTAINEVFMKYVPKDKQEEALSDLENTVHKLIQQIGVTPAGRELLKQLDRAGLQLD